MDSFPKIGYLRRYILFGPLEFPNGAIHVAKIIFPFECERKIEFWSKIDGSKNGFRLVDISENSIF